MRRATTLRAYTPTAGERRPSPPASPAFKLHTMARDSSMHVLVLVLHITCCRYWTDSATSDLVAEVLQALQQQQDEEHALYAVHGVGSSSCSSSEQQLLAFWNRVMPIGEALTCHRS